MPKSKGCLFQGALANLAKENYSGMRSRGRSKAHFAAPRPEQPKRLRPPDSASLLPLPTRFNTVISTALLVFALGPNPWLIGICLKMAVPDSSTNRDTAKAVEPLILSTSKVDDAPTSTPSQRNSPRGSLSPTDTAERELDAALQLLAERAQYITGASGAAIALRRGRHNDMLCRASAGASAPELGTLLSMEYGFTGESVRTCQTLFCKDAQTDGRVNREGCKQLGIASVVAMPILSDGRALGVFELFSAKPGAFMERDFAVLRRLGEMVETVVKHAAACQGAPVPDIAGQGAGREQQKAEGTQTIPLETSLSEAETEAQTISASDSNSTTDTNAEATQKTEPDRSAPKPFYWSVGMQAEAAQAAATEIGKSIPVPAVLRDLKKCQACGFPVSQGRTLCVECEEKQWRGQLGVKSNTVTGTLEAQRVVLQNNGSRILSKANPPDSETVQPRNPASPAAAASGRSPVAGRPVPIPARAALENRDSIENSTLFQSPSSQSESWLAARKFVLIALLLVAMVVAALVWMR